MNNFPKTIEECHTLHPQLMQQILNYANKTLVHTIVYGQPGTGKTTLVKALLSKHFHVPLTTLYKCSTLEYTWNNTTFKILRSNYHFEINVQHLTKIQQQFIPEFILEISKTMNIFTNTYKIITFYNAEYLDKSIQHQLRRIMETQSGNCRLIFIVHNVVNIDDTIRSRCISIHVPKPSSSACVETIEQYLSQLQQQQQSQPQTITTSTISTVKLTKRQLQSLIKKYNGNMKKIMLGLQYKLYGISQSQNEEDIYEKYSKEIMQQIQSSGSKHKSSSSASALGITTTVAVLRKCWNDITTTCLDIPPILDQLVQTIHSAEWDIQKKIALLDCITYYTYLYEHGYKKYYQMEAMCIKMYILLH